MWPHPQGSCLTPSPSQQHGGETLPPAQAACAWPARASSVTELCPLALTLMPRVEGSRPCTSLTTGCSGSHLAGRGSGGDWGCAPSFLGVPPGSFYHQAPDLEPVSPGNPKVLAAVSPERPHRHPEPDVEELTAAPPSADESPASTASPLSHTARSYSGRRCAWRGRRLPKLLLGSRFDQGDTCESLWGE